MRTARGKCVDCGSRVAVDFAMMDEELLEDVESLMLTYTCSHCHNEQSIVVELQPNKEGEPDAMEVAALLASVAMSGRPDNVSQRTRHMERKLIDDARVALGALRMAERHGERNLGECERYRNIAAEHLARLADTVKDAV